MPELPIVPGHLAIIMDGNGRWAKQHGLPRLEGHRRGAVVARQTVEWAADLGIRYLSLFAFSTENWARPQSEVQGLMRLLATLLPRQIPEMQRQGVKLRTMGDITALPERPRRAVERAIKATRECRRIDLILCLNYGGQQEILEGVKRVCAWAGTQHDPAGAVAALDAEGFRRFLWCADVPPVDLLLRTGGEQRISNFYLWDAAYCELCFSPKLWPDFNEQDLREAIADYARRERRFGLISEQVRA